MSDASRTPTPPTVAVFDAFAGNDVCIQELRVALASCGVNATVTADPAEGVAADGLVLAASGDTSAALQAFNRAHAPRVVGQRLAGSRPVLAIGAAMDALFERDAQGQAGFGEWPGGVAKLAAVLRVLWGLRLVHVHTPLGRAPPATLVVKRWALTHC